MTDEIPRMWNRLKMGTVQDMVTIPEMFVWARLRVVRLYMFLQATGSPPDSEDWLSRGMLMLRSRDWRLLMALQVAACHAQFSVCRHFWPQALDQRDRDFNAPSYCRAHALSTQCNGLLRALRKCNASDLFRIARQKS